MALRALASLQPLARLTAPTMVERDAAIHRFEYTSETSWKLAQLFLLREEGVAVGSPKAAVRASLEAGLLDDAAAARALQMVDDRNSTVHTYQEALAQQIFARLAAHSALLAQWIASMQARLPAS
ncbi:MAG TPA: nucleotidyltransferase substrate binding protein [Myxococcales bacterium]|nr:nucleotidyltransferase substrate binding protein [Myxococcales bacterium]